MVKETTPPNIELRSEEFQEIVEQSPRWIIRSGIFLVLGFLIVFFAGSYIFSYPDLVESRITISATTTLSRADSATGSNVLQPIASDSLIHGNIILSMVQARKVENGQRVKVVFDDFPSPEFVAMEGRVSSISSIDKSNSYFAEVILSTRIKATPKINYKVYAGMNGTATIITADISLLERFLKPLKKFFK